MESFVAKFNIFGLFTMLIPGIIIILVMPFGHCLDSIEQLSVIEEGGLRMIMHQWSNFFISTFIVILQ